MTYNTITYNKITRLELRPKYAGTVEWIEAKTEKIPSSNNSMTCLAPTVQICSHWESRTITYIAGKKMKRRLPTFSPFLLPTYVINKLGEASEKERPKAKKRNKVSKRVCISFQNYFFSAWSVVKKPYNFSSSGIYKIVCSSSKKSFWNWVFLFRGNLSSAAIW